MVVHVRATQQWHHLALDTAEHGACTRSYSSRGRRKSYNQTYIRADVAVYNERETPTVTTALNVQTRWTRWKKRARCANKHLISADKNVSKHAEYQDAQQWAEQMMQYVLPTIHLTDAKWLTTFVDNSVQLSNSDVFFQQQHRYRRFVKTTGMTCGPMIYSPDTAT